MRGGKQTLDMKVAQNEKQEGEKEDIILTSLC